MLKKGFFGMLISIVGIILFLLVTGCDNGTGGNGGSGDEITLSGFIRGGEFNSEHITSAIIKVYSDESRTNLINSVSISDFSKVAEPPFYYTNTWSMAVPSSFINNKVYFSVDETLTGGATGERDFTWYQSLDYIIDVYKDGVSNIKLETSYTWGKYINSGNEDEVIITVKSDGSAEIKTVAVDENWKHAVDFSFPAQVGEKYKYQFKAKTDIDEYEMGIMYYFDFVTPEYGIENITIDNTLSTYNIISSKPVVENCTRLITFQVGSNQPQKIDLELISIEFNP